IFLQHIAGKIIISLVLSSVHVYDLIHPFHAQNTRGDFCMHRSYLHAGLLAAVLGFSAILPVHAATSGQPVKLVVGASPGGTTDRVARGIAHEMSSILGQ